MSYSLNKQPAPIPTDVKAGNRIQFERKNAVIVGVIISVREKTVMVEISHYYQELLNLETTLTVVNHKNYEVV